MTKVFRSILDFVSLLKHPPLINVLTKISLSLFYQICGACIGYSWMQWLRLTFKSNLLQLGYRDVLLREGA